MSTATSDRRFAVFILTHGRPRKQRTLRSLLKQGYTGDYYLVVDNEDSTIGEYRRLYGDRVIVFDKAAVAQRIDEADNFGDRRAVVYARNVCFELAERLGLTHFLQLDDDYAYFAWKFTASLVYKHRLVRNLDRLFETMLRFYDRVPAVTVALAQGGDFLGGGRGDMGRKIWLKRKAMNTFFCAVGRPFRFVGRVNEDVNTYVVEGHRGKLFLTVNMAMIKQETTQASAGGMSGLYLDEGTYRKSFYTVMYAPSCARISQMGDRHRRVYHRILWNQAVPCILREEYRKVPHCIHEQSQN